VGEGREMGKEARGEIGGWRRGGGWGRGGGLKGRGEDGGQNEGRSRGVGGRGMRRRGEKQKV